MPKIADLVKLTEEILNGKLHFLCSVILACVTEITKPRKIQHFLNPFYASVPFLHSMKILENLCFSTVFCGYRNCTLV